MNEKILIYGGAFDPVHDGHVAVFRAAIDAVSPSRALMMPAAEHPAGKRLTPFDHRSSMCRAAIRGLHQRAEVSDLERWLAAVTGAPSYTALTVLALSTANPGAELYMVLGADAFDAQKWDAAHWALICATVKLVVVSRAGASSPSPGMIPADALHVELDMQVSSTEIREHYSQNQHRHPAVCDMVHELAPRIYGAG